MRTHRCYCPICHKEIRLPIFSGINDPTYEYSPCEHFCEGDFRTAIFRGDKTTVKVERIPINDENEYTGSIKDNN